MRHYTCFVIFDEKVPWQPILKLTSDQYVAIFKSLLLQENICIRPTERVHKVKLTVLNAMKVVVKILLSSTTRDIVQLLESFLRERNISCTFRDSLANLCWIDVFICHRNIQVKLPNTILFLQFNSEAISFAFTGKGVWNLHFSELLSHRIKLYCNLNWPKNS